MFMKEENTENLSISFIVFRRQAVANDTLAKSSPKEEHALKPMEKGYFLQRTALKKRIKVHPSQEALAIGEQERRDPVKECYA